MMITAIFVGDKVIYSELYKAIVFSRTPTISTDIVISFEDSLCRIRTSSEFRRNFLKWRNLLNLLIGYLLPLAVRTEFFISLREEQATTRQALILFDDGITKYRHNSRTLLDLSRTPIAFRSSILEQFTPSYKQVSEILEVAHWSFSHTNPCGEDKDHNSYLCNLRRACPVHPCTQRNAVELPLKVVLGLLFVLPFLIAPSLYLNFLWTLLLEPFDKSPQLIFNISARSIFWILQDQTYGRDRDFGIYGKLGHIKSLAFVMQFVEQANSIQQSFQIIFRQCHKITSTLSITINGSRLLPSTIF